MAILLAGTISGCVKEMNCKLAKDGVGHCHEFKTDSGFKAWRISENETLYAGRFGESYSELILRVLNERRIIKEAGPVK